jgi:hypothetical protein
MGKVQVSAEGLVHAPAEVVYGYLADMREHHPKILPPAFSGFEVESGGIGAGTIIRYALTAGGRTRQFRSEVVLTESDTNSSAVTTFTVTPAGENCTVRIASEWNGASGIGGFFERTFAPRVLRGIFADQLTRMDAYARERARPS